jgi:DNA polymerase-3 subunit epsilon
MREIVLDTETTGLSPEDGHRITEIGCVELINQIPSGRTYQQYINPERDVPEMAFKITGLSTQFLSTFPLFHQVASHFLQFVGDSPLIIHNADFDMRFLNFELKKANLSLLSFDRVVDTLVLARKRFPGSPNSLDALCKRYEINLSHREKHGALLDSELLAQVYLELTGGRQRGFAFQAEAAQRELEGEGRKRPSYAPRSFPLSPEEVSGHDLLVAQLKNPLWKVG